MKKLSIFTSSLLLFFTSSLRSVYAQQWSSTCVDKGDVATIQGFECLFKYILNSIIYFAGLGFFLMLIFGGYKYISSNGDPKKVGEAQVVLTNAFMGLIGVVCSYLIIKFIGDFTGINVTKFEIPK